MKRHTAISQVATAASAAIVLSFFVSPANAESRPKPDRVVTYANAVPGLAPPDIGDRGRYVDENGRVINMTTSGTATPEFGCKPDSLPDNPHYTAPDVSGHGQWNKGTCTANTAHVQNCIYEFYTDDTWRRKKCSAKVRLKPKSVSNNRTNARRACDSTGRLISWRNHVDVDVDGQVDQPDVPYRQANVACVITGPDQ